MSASSKKVLGIALGVLLLAAAGGYFVGIPMWEKEQAKKIEEFLARLPGTAKVERISVSLLQKGATLHGFSGSYTDESGNTHKLDAKELSLSGLNFSAPTAKGVVQLADKVSANGLSFASNVLGIASSGSIQEVTASNITGDLAALIDPEIRKAPPLKRIEILSAFHVGGVSAKGISQTVESPSGPLAVSIGSMESKNMTLAGGGDYVLTQVKSSVADRRGMQSEFAFDKMTISGVNDKAILEKKFSTIVQSMGIQGMTLVSRESGALQRITAKEMALRDLRADLGTLSEQGLNNAPASQILGTLVQTRVGQISVVGYGVAHEAGILGSYGFTVESAEARDVSMLQCGETNWRGVGLSVLGSEKAHVGSLSLKRAQLPDVVTAILRSEESDMSDEETFALLEKEKLVIDHLVISDVRVAPTDEKDPLTVKSFTLDVDANLSNISVKKSMEEFVVPAAIYRQLDHKMELFADIYGKPLNFSGRSDVEVTHAKGKGDIHIKTVSFGDDSLGNATLSADLNFVGHPDILKFFDKPVEVKLVKSQLSLQDKALIGLLFDVQYKEASEFETMPEGVTSKTLRDVGALKIQNLAASYPTKELQNLIQACADFVRNSGTLSISLNPPAPVSVMDLNNAELLPEGTLGIQAKWVPGINMAPATAPAAPAK